MSMQPYDRQKAKAKLKTNHYPRSVDVRRLAALERNASPVYFLGGWNPRENKIE